MDDKVLIALMDTDNFEEFLIKYFNPLELENVHEDLTTINWPLTRGADFGNYIYALRFNSC